MLTTNKLKYLTIDKENTRFLCILTIPFNSNILSVCKMLTNKNI